MKIEALIIKIKYPVMCDNRDDKVHYLAEDELEVRLTFNYEARVFCKECSHLIYQKLAPVLNTNLWIYL